MRLYSQETNDYRLLPHIRPTVVMLLLFSGLTGIAYPLAMTAVAQLAFPDSATGSLIRKNGSVVGSALVGEAFNTDRYFHPRPSATTGADPQDATKSVAAPYNAANSAGSNLGPTSQALLDRVKADIAALKASTGTVEIPADAVTASASGLDPHLSPAFALLQVGRIAKARHLPPDRLRQLVTELTVGPILGILGKPRLNVLRLNLALDALPAT